MNTYIIVEDCIDWRCDINPPIKEIKELQATNVHRLICITCNECIVIIPYGDSQCVNSGFFKQGTAYICNESLSTK